MTKNELLKEIEESWSEFMALIGGIDEEKLTGARDSAGWTVKDQLVHLAAWERSALFLLQGRPRHEGLGVEKTLYLSDSVDEINDAIFEQTRQLPLQQVLRQLHDVHDEVVNEIMAISDVELQRAVREFLPDEPGEGSGPAVIEVVYDNTAGHYVEHHDWIKALLV